MTIIGNAYGSSSGYSEEESAKLNKQQEQINAGQPENKTSDSQQSAGGSAQAKTNTPTENNISFTPTAEDFARFKAQGGGVIVSGNQTWQVRGEPEHKYNPQEMTVTINGIPMTFTKGATEKVGGIEGLKKIMNENRSESRTTYNQEIVNQAVANANYNIAVGKAVKPDVMITPQENDYQIRLDQAMRTKAMNLGVADIIPYTLFDPFGFSQLSAYADTSGTIQMKANAAFESGQLAYVRTQYYDQPEFIKRSALGAAEIASIGTAPFIFKSPVIRLGAAVLMGGSATYNLVTEAWTGELEFSSTFENLATIGLSAAGIYSGVREISNIYENRRIVSMEKEIESGNIKNGLALNERTIKYGELIERQEGYKSSPEIRQNILNLDETARIGRSATTLRTDTLALTRTEVVMSDELGSYPTTVYDSLRTAPTQEPLGKISPKDWLIVIKREGQNYGFISTDKGISLKPVMIDTEYFNPSSDVIVRTMKSNGLTFTVKVEPELEFSRVWTQGFGKPVALKLTYEPYYSYDFKESIGDFTENVLTQGSMIDAGRQGAQRVMLFGIERQEGYKVNVKPPTRSSNLPLEFVPEITDNTPKELESSTSRGLSLKSEVQTNKINLVRFNVEELPQELKNMFDVRSTNIIITEGSKTTSLIQESNINTGIYIRNYNWNNQRNPSVVVLENRPEEKRKEKIDIVPIMRLNQPQRDFIDNRQNISQPQRQEQRQSFNLILVTPEKFSFSNPEALREPSRTRERTPDEINDNFFFRKASLGKSVITVSGNRNQKPLKISSSILPTVSDYSLEQAYSRYGHGSLARGSGIEKIFREQVEMAGLSHVGVPAAEFIKHGGKRR